MQHKQSLWDKFIGRMVIDSHVARRVYGHGTKSYIEEQTWRYSECPWVKLLQFIHIDKRGWFRTMKSYKRKYT